MQRRQIGLIFILATILALVVTPVLAQLDAPPALGQWDGGNDRYLYCTGPGDLWIRPIEGDQMLVRCIAWTPTSPPSPLDTPTPTATDVLIPTVTPTLPPTITPNWTDTPTVLPTMVPTETPLPPPTAAATWTPTPTPTITPNWTPTITPTETISMTELTLQPDATDGVDTWLYSAASTTNYGTWTTLWMHNSSGGGYGRVLLKFDLSSIPAGVTYNSIILTVWSDNASDGNQTITAYRVLSGNSGWTEAAATWDTIEGSTSWAGSAGCSTSGTDFSSTALGSASRTSPDGSGTQHDFSEFDTTEFEAMRANNYGILIAMTASAETYYDYWKIRSSDHATAATRPQLYVNYTEAGGGGGALLLHSQQMAYMGGARR